MGESTDCFCEKQSDRLACWGLNFGLQHEQSTSTLVHRPAVKRQHLCPLPCRQSSPCSLFANVWPSTRSGTRGSSWSVPRSCFCSTSASATTPGRKQRAATTQSTHLRKRSPRRCWMESRMRDSGDGVRAPFPPRPTLRRRVTRREALRFTTAAPIKNSCVAASPSAGPMEASRPAQCPVECDLSKGDCR